MQCVRVGGVEGQGGRYQSWRERRRGGKVRGGEEGS